MAEKARILVSACLLGVRCRYDGGGKLMPELRDLMENAELIPICPEIFGGLPTPRVPAERQGDRVRMRDGTDVTAQFARGAQEAAALAARFGARIAVLKERSPSCGAGEIYDGTFTGGKIPGDGMTAERLKAEGIEVYGESRMDELIQRLKEA